MPELLVIVGSLREGRQSLRVAEHVYRALSEISDDAALFDIRDYAAAPPYDGVTQTAETRELARRFSDAAGFVFVVPEWHAGLPGHLKNLIDYLGADQFAGKPVGIVGVSSGNGAAIAVSSLRDILGVLGATFVGPAPYVRNVKAAWDEQSGALLDERLNGAIGLMLRRLVELNRALAAAHA
jgi:NAD(P)H-dependent FMN reductase